MTLDADTRALLAETAFLACITGQTAAARVILAGLGDGGREVMVGQALVEMTEGRPDDAASLLTAAAESGDGYARVFRALALRLAGRAAECDAALAAVPAGDPAVDKMAAALRAA